MRIGSILLAGGTSSRMGGRSKTLLPLLGKPVLLYGFELLQSIEAIEELVVVGDEENLRLLPEGCLTASPGLRRQDSVMNGFQKLSKNLDYILIHDAARPLTVREDVLKLLSVGETTYAAALASPVRNSLKKIYDPSPYPLVHETVAREDLWEVYTPQMVRYDLFATALSRSKEEGWEVTDDIALLEKLGDFPATLVPVSFPNIKITYPEDITYVTALLTHQIQAYSCL
ncbi:MAG: 2-C-methyl-D-erythritol 4-phosphate cytidylyltransferase [Verrucomicrobia bacterium]|nr:2-C-methyl-D-erythritol 4-phosphate cytidylyltransferase [Verrucomicrobiota bacterium]